MSIKETVKQILINRETRSYEKELFRKKSDYHEWVKWDEGKKKVSYEGEPQEYVIWKLAGGTLSKEAEAQLDVYFHEHPKVLILYGDEDVQNTDGVRSNPWVKPCWSPDTYLSYFYVGSVVAVRRELLDKAGVSIADKLVEYEKTDEIRELMDRLFGLAGGFERASTAIARVPYVLYHASDKAVWDTHFESKGKIDERTDKLPGVSVIIPSKDNPAILKQCLDSLAKQKASFEIIVVDNGSKEENRAKIEEMTKGMKYIYKPMEFNFSKMCNIGAEQAGEPLLLFLNDDVELCENDWLQRMSSKAVKSYVGAVGLKLYYPGGNLIQHAGVVNLPVGPDHKLRTLPDTEDYYFGWSLYTRNYVAATGACLLIEAKKYREIGGFPEELAVCYNDVALCFQLLEQGYQNVVVNEAYAYHHESISRGMDDNPEKFARFVREWNRLYELHPAFKEEDPYYPAELDRWLLDNKVQPAYIFGIHEIQKPKWRKMTAADIRNIRYDDCLMARVETYNKEKIRGYGIVLGDDNACYKRYLVLQPDTESETVSKECFIMPLERMYKKELEDTVPDQKNVALCGYYISRRGEQFKPGAYKAGMLAVNRVTGLKLFSWCGKVLEL